MHPILDDHRNQQSKYIGFSFFLGGGGGGGEPIHFCQAEKASLCDKFYAGLNGSFDKIVKKNSHVVRSVFDSLLEVALCSLSIPLGLPNDISI